MSSKNFNIMKNSEVHDQNLKVMKEEGLPMNKALDQYLNIFHVSINVKI